MRKHGRFSRKVTKKEMRKKLTFYNFSDCFLKVVTTFLYSSCSSVCLCTIIPDVLHVHPYTWLSNCFTIFLYQILPVSKTLTSRFMDEASFMWVLILLQHVLAILSLAFPAMFIWWSPSWLWIWISKTWVFSSVWRFSAFSCHTSLHCNISTFSKT